MASVREQQILAPRQWHRSLAHLSAPHFLVDHYSSTLGASLPFLIPVLGLAMTGAGLLGGALIFSGSLTQPLCGYLTGHFERKLLVIPGPAVSGVFISCLGLATGFPAAFTLVLLGGVGIAAFHPQAAAIVASARRDAPGVQFSIFVTAGMLGFSLGPLLITTVVSLVGLSRSYLAVIPGLVFSFSLYRNESLPLVGLLSDYLGLQTALFVMVCLRFPGLILGFGLPQIGTRRGGRSARMLPEVQSTVLSLGSDCGLREVE